MKKFSVYDWMNKILLEEEQQQQPDQMQPPQTQQQPMTPPKSNNQAFRTIVGKVVSGATFSSNGDSGGEIKIMIKDSYLPFKISWTNETVTVTDLNGNILSLNE
jgi:hypothetical protein